MVYNDTMKEKDLGLDKSWDEPTDFPNLATKLFSDSVCAECESKRILETDAMGREKFWEDLGRP